jgi:hypothetical protein
MERFRRTYLNIHQCANLKKNMMNREFQSFEEFRYVMKQKSYESICVNNINHKFMFEMESVISRFSQDRLNFVFANAESSMNCTLCGITID